MNRYLQIARKIVPAYEINENNEITPVQPAKERLNSYNSLISYPEQRKTEWRPLWLRVTATQKEMAKLVAEARVKANNRTRKANQDNGAEGNYSRDYYGVLAEIVVRQHLETHRLIDAAALVSDRPDKRPDLILHGVRVEVKASRPGYNALAINEEQHQTRKPSPDCYLPCLFDGTGDWLVIMRPIPYNEVTGWPVATNPKNGSRFYHAPRATLTELHSLPELLDALNADAVENDPEPFREDDPDAEEDTTDEFDDLLDAADRDLLPTGIVSLDETHDIANMKNFVRLKHRKLREAQKKGLTLSAKVHAEDLRQCLNAWKREAQT